MRAIANGLNKDEMETVLRQSNSKMNCKNIFALVADAYEGKAKYYDELGLKPRAKDHYFHSALWNFYAHLLMADGAERAKRYALSAFNYAQAAKHFEGTTTKISIPYLSHTLAGYLRLPGLQRQAAESETIRYSTVIIVNALDSTKEELYYTENAFLKAGMATLSFDHLGSGESQCDGNPVFDANDLANALSLFLPRRPQIDCQRIALHGLSFGGNLALKLAAEFPTRFKPLPAFQLLMI